MTICMCSSIDDCGLKKDCYRFCKEPHEFKQPWANMYKREIKSPIGDTGECINFIPIDEYKDIRK